MSPLRAKPTSPIERDHWVLRKSLTPGPMKVELMIRGQASFELSYLACQALSEALHEAPTRPGETFQMDDGQERLEVRTHELHTGKTRGQVCLRIARWIGGDEKAVSFVSMEDAPMLLDDLLAPFRWD
jgi:hypothetical protein